MVELTEKEIECIRKSFIEILQDMKQMTNEKLMEWIRSSGSSLQNVMMFQEAEYLYDEINQNEFANEKVIRAFADINAFWNWHDREYESAEELYSVIEDKEICSIYEKYLELINE